MSIFVSEPARPGPQRLPPALRRRAAARVAASEPMHATASQLDTEAARHHVIEEQAAKRAASRYRDEAGHEALPEIPYLPVAHLSGQTIIDLSSGSTLEEAQGLMEQHGIHHLVVLHEGAVAGLIDLAWVLEQRLKVVNQAAQSHLHALTLPAFITVTPETDAHELARQMLGYRIASALVVDPDNQAIALVTATDYLRLYAQRTQKHESI
ncbi:CBS domain-containing protein [Hydrocarboniclastica marina]|uniref:CBS domain-containing protein n=2 Tax=Hydrocarboniclastica marina TaxID=2259620 RepID=A0A4P7XH04_9ALTE|nr:CBS domain-containing protein [Hydrocarboniclastica marina]